jgi:hypothetical protein
MNHNRCSGVALALGCAFAAVFSTGAGAVEVHDLKGFEPLFGRYAPSGDCKRQPQFVVDVAGFTFEVGGKTEKVTNPEYAASFGGPEYQGTQVWFFPFRTSDGYEILMTFNAGEKSGAVTIDPQDQGYLGGPKASPRNAALLKGSPYAKCK